VDRLTQLAEDLLLIALYDRGRLALRRELIDPAEIVGSVVNRFRWRAEAEGRTLESSAAPQLKLSADRIRIEQALGNLVDNALRHGSGAVRLNAATHNRTVELHVEDEGSGFAPDLLDGAFERFARGAHARADDGAGLGLSIVRAIAKAHGGEAHAENRPDGGADVWLALPRSASALGGGQTSPSTVRRQERN
jgi:signal transduction histidine kinase